MNRIPILIPKQAHARKSRALRPDALQETAKLFDHRERTASIILCLPWLEADLTSIEIHMAECKRHHFAVSPARDIAKASNRYKMRRQVAADSLQTIAFEESFSHVVFLQ